MITTPVEYGVSGYNLVKIRCDDCDEVAYILWRGYNKYMLYHSEEYLIEDLLKIIEEQKVWVKRFSESSTHPQIKGLQLNAENIIKAINKWIVDLQIGSKEYTSNLAE